ncbi:hypothetical protein Dalk_2226 [Desulfatibacillum aliphaticivorans]|uniref:Uncharacterized protein n=1 Tax=Desulfatibacillum aliphaticivorans TaxID=218208 RepID=B8FIC9_DESAL|nr:hypothetical protein Dalk_2226 [Desulfatibacillum aliphaticivorans]
METVLNKAIFAEKIIDFKQSSMHSLARHGSGKTMLKAH